MPNPLPFRAFLGFASLSLLCAPAAAQNPGALAARTIRLLGNICGAQPSDPTLQGASCEIAAGTFGPAVQTQDALQTTPRDQTGASSTATQTTDTQAEHEKKRLAKARGQRSSTAAALDDGTWSGLGGDPRFGAFLSGSGGWGEVDARGEAGDYEVDGGGITAGIDYRVTDRLVAGVGFGWNRQATDFDSFASAGPGGGVVRGSEIDSDSYGGSLYGSFFDGPWYVDGVLSYTYLDYELERPILLVSFLDGTARGDTRADQFGASLGGGYEFDLGGLAVGPTAGVDYRQTWIDGYTESGVPGFPLDYDDQDILSLVTKLGAEASYAISTPIGVVVPHVRGSWQHEFENDARNIDARLFANDSAAPDVLTSRTESPDRDYGRVGGGVSAQFPRGISAFVDYDALVGLSKIEHHRITGGGRIEF